MIYSDKIPTGVTIPKDIIIENPHYSIPETIKSFFGETGKWWGTWTSPQVKGSYDAILLIKQIKNKDEAYVVYLTSTFPKWYIENSRWETNAKFVKKETGRTSLLIPYSPWHTHMECWFEGRTFMGVIYNRFMLSRIIWKPMP